MKTRVTLLMAVFLAVFMFAASAQATGPSITAADLATVITTEVINPTTGQRTRISDMPIPLTGPFSIEIIENSGDVLNELMKIAEFLKETGMPIIEYFDFSVGNQYGELKQKIALLLPQGFDLSTLVMNELVTIEPFFYSDELGDVLATFAFPTEYREDQIVVAVIGIYDDNGNVEWIPLKAETVKDANGRIGVQIQFTQEALVKASDKPFALAILSD